MSYKYLFLQKTEPEFSKSGPGAARVWTNVGVSLQLRLFLQLVADTASVRFEPAAVSAVPS